jgi:hypothetical protein
MEKYYITTITLKILSEDTSTENLDLEQIPYAVNEGDCVLFSDNRKAKEVSKEKMSQLLIDAGSDPGFFGLDDEEEDED